MKPDEQASAGPVTAARLVEVLRALRPAPERWVKAAQQLPSGKTTRGSASAVKRVLKRQFRLTLLTFALVAMLAPAAHAVSFSGPTTYPVDGPSPLAGAAGDFNRDGKRDLAMTVGVPSNWEHPGGISILLGDGEGGFGNPTVVPSGRDPFYIAVGDFDNDSNPDLGVLREASQVSILLGHGNGTFAPPTQFRIDSQARQAVVDDFDGDGNQDLAVVHYHRIDEVRCKPVYAYVCAHQPTPNITILLGKGDGSFQEPAMFFADNSPDGIAIGDFNEDGDRDLAVSNRLSANVSILLGIGNGTFSPPINHGAGGSGPRNMTVEDFDHDGHEDILVSAGAGVSVLLGKGDATFSSPIHSASDSSSVRIGDFDRDGNADLAAVAFNSDYISILLGTGTGTFLQSARFATGGDSYARLPVIANLNGDARPDIAFANTYSADVSVFLNTTTVGLLSPTGVQNRSGMSFTARLLANPAVTEARFWVDLPAAERESPHHSFSCTQVSQPGDCQFIGTDDEVEQGYYSIGGFFGGSPGEHTATVQLWRRAWGDATWVLVDQDHSTFTYSP